MAELDLTVDCKMLERLAKAIQKTRKELDRLADMPHGGVEIHIVGEVCSVVVKPCSSGSALPAGLDSEGRLTPEYKAALERVFGLVPIKE